MSFYHERPFRNIPLSAPLHRIPQPIADAPLAQNTVFHAHGCPFSTWSLHASKTGKLHSNVSRVFTLWPFPHGAAPFMSTQLRLSLSLVAPVATSIVLHAVIVTCAAYVATHAQQVVHTNEAALATSHGNDVSDGWFGNTTNVDLLTAPVPQSPARTQPTQQRPQVATAMPSSSKRTHDATSNKDDSPTDTTPSNKLDRQDARPLTDTHPAFNPNRDDATASPAHGTHSIDSGSDGQTDNNTSDNVDGGTGNATTDGFGAVGRPRGMRHLATAFSRAMPMAYSTETVWNELSLGRAGSLELTVNVGHDGEINATTPEDSVQAPKHLIELVRRTIMLLRNGTFSLSQTQPTSGTQRFLLEATIEQVPTPTSDDPSRAGPVAFGYETPRKGAPGFATFTLRTGRKVTIRITLVDDN